MLWEFVLVLCQSLWNHEVSVNLATAVSKPFCVYPTRALATPVGGVRSGEGHLPWSKAWYAMGQRCPRTRLSVSHLC